MPIVMDEGGNVQPNENEEHVEQVAETEDPEQDFFPIPTPSFPHGLDRRDATDEELVTYREELEEMQARKAAAERPEDEEPLEEPDKAGDHREVGYDAYGAALDGEALSHADAVETVERTRRSYRHKPQRKERFSTGR